MMDGAHSANPKKMPAPEHVQPKDEDVNMEDADAEPAVGTHDSAIVMDPRGHGRGQTEEQIKEQQRRIEETTKGIWNSRAAQAA